MLLLKVFVVTATVLTGLVGGIAFVFAAVVMPGLAMLPDRDFLRAFQKVDAVIQANQPLFLFVWIGSFVFAVTASVSGFVWADRPTAWGLAAIAAASFGGIHLPTATINIPLNNRVQAVDFDAAGDAEVADLRRRFETPWNRANTFRTVVAVLLTASLGGMLLRL
ncbi:MAG: anthrone oxygenase family protein [Planctomycetota bacterium]